MKSLCIVLAVIGGCIGIVAGFIRSFAGPSSATYRNSTIALIAGMAIIGITAFVYSRS
jgi:hypothetical protein